MIPTTNGNQINGLQVFWVLAQLALAVMTQRSANTRHTSRKMFLKSPDPLRSLPAVCLADGIVDILTMVRAWGIRRKQSPEDRIQLKKVDPQLKWSKLAIFLLAAVPAIKLYAVRGIWQEQACVAIYAFSYITGCAVELSGIPTRYFCPVCATGFWPLLVGILATLGFYTNIAINLWTWHTIGDMDTGHSAELRVTPAVFYLLIISLALVSIYLTFGATSQIFSPVKSSTTVKFFRVLRYFLTPVFIILMLLNWDADETNGHPGSVVHTGKHGIGYLIMTLGSTIILGCLAHLAFRHPNHGKEGRRHSEHYHSGRHHSQVHQPDDSQSNHRNSDRCHSDSHHSNRRHSRRHHSDPHHAEHRHSGRRHSSARDLEVTVPEQSHSVHRHLDQYQLYFRPSDPPFAQEVTMSHAYRDLHGIAPHNTDPRDSLNSQRPHRCSFAELTQPISPSPSSQPPPAKSESLAPPQTLREPRPADLENQVSPHTRCSPPSHRRQHSTLQSLGTFFKMIWRRLTSFLEWIWRGLATFLEWVWRGLITPLEWIWRGLVTFLEWVWGGLVRFEKYLSESFVAWRVLVCSLKWMWKNLVRFETYLAENKMATKLSKETAYVMWCIGFFHCMTFCFYYGVAFDPTRTSIHTWAMNYLG